MLDPLNFYYEFIIKPIEEERDKLLRETSNKNIFGFLFENQNKKLLEEYEKMLLEKYRKAGQLFDEELEFYDQIKSLFNN